jgi:hypothetical protein
MDECTDLQASNKIEKSGASAGVTAGLSPCHSEEPQSGHEESHFQRQVQGKFSAVKNSNGALGVPIFNPFPRLSASHF